jgi:hypothetical protein
MDTTPASAARQPGKRLVLLSLVAALFTPVALSLTVVLYRLVIAPAPHVCGPGIGPCPPPEPPLTQLVMTIVLDLEALNLLSLPAAGVAIISGHLAVSRLRHHPAPRAWRKVAWCGLILGYGAAVFIVAYLAWVMQGGLGGD